MEPLYNTLDPTLRQIRLLHIQPGDWDDTIECSLHVVSLNDGHEYQGLSYVWGDPAICKEIILQGRQFDVTINLWRALRRLRRAYHERVIWIDATCTNQSDIAERSNQVALMRDIYSSASEIFVWLGESISEEDSEGNVSKNECSLGSIENGKDLKDVVEYAVATRRVGSDHSEDSNILGAFEVLHLLSIDEHWNLKPLFLRNAEDQYVLAAKYSVAWKLLLKMFQLPWFSRVWVVQEVLLARTATMVLGSISIPWKLVIDFMESYAKHMRPSNEECCYSSVSWKMVPELWNEIEELRFPLEVFHQAQKQLEPTEKEKLLSPFRALLWLLKHRNASDPRDKIFGVLGLVPKDVEAVKADYSMTDADVFSQSTAFLFETERTLAPLQGPRLRSAGLPTWAMDLLPNKDYHKKILFGNMHLRIRHQMSPFNADRGQELRYSINGLTLRLHGVCVDTVRYTACGRVEGQERDAIEHWETLAGFGYHATPIHPSGCTRYEAFWRTLCNDVVRYFEDGSEKIRRAKSTDEAAYKTFRRWLAGIATPSELANEDFISFRSTFFLATQFFHFFTTEKGYFGFSDPPIKGDEIWILAGGRVPFLLRPYPQESADAGKYLLVSDCFVHGIMDGEALEGWKESDSREVILIYKGCMGN